MPRFRGIKSPINTVKHFIQQSNTQVTTGTVLTIELADVVVRGGTISATSDITEGAIIKAVHCEYWLNGTGATNSTQQTLIIYKAPSGAASADVTNMLNLQTYANKKNIFYTTQGNLGATGNQSVRVIGDWILIPKGKQRFGLGDKLFLTILTSGENLNICGLTIYKEFV